MECIYSSVREISVRKLTVEKGSASRGMIVMCGEKQIEANAEHFLVHLRKCFHHSGVETSTEVVIMGEAQNVGTASSHLALTCIHTHFRQDTLIQTS